jgi:hypothetical protein
VIDGPIRLATAGMRAGWVLVGVSMLPVRVVWEAAWPRLQARGDAAFEALLEGPLTEQLARALGEHRVIERVADELIANGTVTALVDQALQAGLGEQIAERLLAPDVLDSRVLLELTDRVMASEEMQRVIAHIASSPELRAAIAEQSSGLADEMVEGVRRRTVSLDDVAERTVRGWLRRPRPSPT